MGKLHPTNIQWCTHTVNPVVAVDRATGKQGWACTKVATGCMHCYAEALNVGRFGTGHPFDVASEALVEWRLDEAALDSVLRRRKPATIFWCDMTDLFHERVPDDWIDRCFAVMALTPHLRHIVLTKRPEMVFPWFSSSPWDELRIRKMFTAAMAWQPMGLIPQFKAALSAFGWPLPNVAFGTSVSNQDDADRNIPQLLDTPAALRFVSYEPATGPVNWRRGIYTMFKGWTPQGTSLQGIDAIIIGGESGPKARPFDLAWAHSTIAQCEAAGVVAMVKQLGTNAIGLPMARWRREGTTHRGDPCEWPEALRPHAASPERWPWAKVEQP